MSCLTAREIVGKFSFDLLFDANSFKLGKTVRKKIFCQLNGFVLSLKGYALYSVSSQVHSNNLVQEKVGLSCIC